MIEQSRFDLLFFPRVRLDVVLEATVEVDKKSKAKGSRWVDQGRVKVGRVP